jgi:hypothetical protein
MMLVSDLGSISCSAGEEGRLAFLQFLTEPEALEEQEMKEDNLSQYYEVNIRKRLPVAWAA